MTRTEANEIYDTVPTPILNAWAYMPIDEHEQKLASDKKVLDLPKLASPVRARIEDAIKQREAFIMLAS